MFLSKKGAFNAFKNSTNRKESAFNQATRKYFSETVDFDKLVKEKSPEANLKLKNRKVMELSFAVTLALLIGVAQISKQVSLSVAATEKADIQIEVADIPQTQQFRKPPPPPRPSVPIPTEDESIPDDLTIASTELDFSDIPPPPPPPEDDDGMIFVAYDEAPEIIGGMSALLKHLKYPRLAQNAGIEGIVFVKVLVGTNGSTEKAEILKARPANMGFEKSAINALKKIKWEPAKQRDRKIRVWVSIPVQFKLINS